MTVIAPTDPIPNQFDPVVVENTGELTPFLGSKVQRVVRLGDRWGANIGLAPMSHADAGKWLAFLMAARRDVAVIEWQEPGLRVVGYGTPLVAGAGQSGSVLNIDGLPAFGRVEAGKMFSILSGERRSLHMVTARTDATSGGAASLPIWPPLRFSPADNAVVELAKPMLQGFIKPAQSPWTPRMAYMAGITFQLLEAE